MATITAPGMLALPGGAPSRRSTGVTPSYPAAALDADTHARVALLDMPFASSGKPVFYADTTGHYSGVITQTDGITPVSNVIVALYQRSSNEVVRRARTNALGAFRFDGLYPGSNDYYAVALDPAGGILQNSLINDRIVPTSTFVPNTLSYIAGAMTIQDSASSCTVAIPPGTAVDDMMVLSFAHGNTPSTGSDLLTMPPGDPNWIPIWAVAALSGSGNYTVCDMFFKQATAANIATGTVTFTKAPATGPFCGQIITVKSTRGYPRIFSIGGSAPANSACAAQGNMTVPIFPTGVSMGYNMNTYNTPASVAILAFANWPIGTGLFDSNIADTSWVKTSPGPTQYKRLDTFVKILQPGEAAMRINTFTSTGGTTPGYTAGWPCCLIGGLFQSTDP